MDEQTREDIKKACQVLREGGVILYPTDTIWGLGCDASNSDAVRRIFSIKQREDSKSMLMLLDSDAKLNSYVPDIPDIAYDLIDMAERPLTIVYDNVRYVAPELKAEDGSVGGHAGCACARPRVLSEAALQVWPSDSIYIGKY